MKKLIFLCQILSLICTISLIFSCNYSPKEQEQKPNIIFILADDLGWADLPAYGNHFNEAPQLSKLAREGIRFTNAYAACPVCSPTRASIQSGQYPARVGIIDFIPGHWRSYEEVIVPKNKTQYLPTDITSLGEAIKTAGYKTGYFGKWHLGFLKSHFPGNRGYDEAYEYTGGGYFNPKFHPDYYVKDPNQPLSDILTDMSLNFIETNKDTSFFLFLAHYDVHVQLDSDSALIDKYIKKGKVNNYPCNAVYAAMVERLDKSVGRILDKLDELELTENTIVVFFSDNGGLKSRFDGKPLLTESKQHIYQGDSLLHIASSNKPLRAEKGTVYEGGIREPLIVRWPGKVAPGQISEELVSSVDFYPTFLSIAGGKLPETQIFDGKDITSEIMGKRSDNQRAIFWHYPVYHHDVPKSVIRKGEWKLVENLIDYSYELYNLKEDISEKNNLADSNPQKLEELKTELKAWQKDAGAEFPIKNPNFDAQKRKIWGVHPDVYDILKERKNEEKE